RRHRRDLPNLGLQHLVREGPEGRVPDDARLERQRPHPLRFLSRANVRGDRAAHRHAGHGELAPLRLARGRRASARARAHQRSRRRAAPLSRAAGAVRRACARDPTLPGAAVGRVLDATFRGISGSREPLCAAIAQPLSAEPARADGDPAAMKYLLRRFAFYAIAAWTSVTLAFVVPRLMPGDPASALVSRFAGKLKPEALGALRQAFGF